MLGSRACEEKGKELGWAGDVEAEEGLTAPGGAVTETTKLNSPVRVDQTTWDNEHQPLEGHV